MSKGQVRVFVLLLILLAMEAALQPSIQSFFRTVGASMNRSQKNGSV